MVFIDVPNYSVLSQGMVVKNYKALCELLGAKTYGSGSASQKAQYKEFARFFSWEKNGHKFIIKEVYEQPLPKVAYQSKFVQYLDPLIMQLPVVYHDTWITLSCNQLYSYLGLINYDYTKDLFTSLTREENMSDLTLPQIDWFKMRVKSKAYQTVSSSLNSLKNRELIDWGRNWMVLNEGYGLHAATGYEQDLITTAETRALATLGFRTKFQMMLCDQQKAFYEEVDKYLADDPTSIKKYYSAFEICFYEESFEELSKEVVTKLKTELNQVWLEAVDHDVEVRYAAKETKSRKEREEIDKRVLFGKANKSQYDKIFSYPEDYVDVQTRLNHRLLKMAS